MNWRQERQERTGILTLRENLISPISQKTPSQLSQLSHKSTITEEFVQNDEEM